MVVLERKPIALLPCAFSQHAKALAYFRPFCCSLGRMFSGFASFIAGRRVGGPGPVLVCPLPSLLVWR